MAFTPAELASVRALITGALRTPIPTRGPNDIPTSAPWAPRDKAQLDTLDLLEGVQNDLIIVGSTQQWEDDAQPPGGTRATPYLPALPEGFTQAKLHSMTYWNAFAPGAGENLALRVFKYVADGSSFVQMTNTLNINSTFSDFETVDVSSVIRNLFWAPGDILALSRVYTVGAGRLQAPLISWNFELVPAGTSEDAPTLLTPVVWPPI